MFIKQNCNYFDLKRKRGAQKEWDRSKGASVSFIKVVLFLVALLITFTAFHI